MQSGCGLEFQSKQFRYFYFRDTKQAGIIFLAHHRRH